MSITLIAPAVRCGNMKLSAGEYGGRTGHTRRSPRSSIMWMKPSSERYVVLGDLVIGESAGRVEKSVVKRPVSQLDPGRGMRPENRVRGDAVNGIHVALLGRVFEELFDVPAIRGRRSPEGDEAGGGEP